MGPLVGTGEFGAEFQESTDRAVWSACGGTASSSLTPKSETELAPEFSKAWMRLLVRFAVGSGDPPVATLWAVGTLDRRNQ